MRLTSETRELLAEVCTGKSTVLAASAAADSCVFVLLLRRGLVPCFSERLWPERCLTTLLCGHPLLCCS